MSARVNAGSMTGRIDALEKSQVRLVPHDQKTITQCTNAVARIAMNKPTARFELVSLDA